MGEARALAAAALVRGSGITAGARLGCSMTPLTAARLEHYVGKGNMGREPPGAWKGAGEAHIGEGRGAQKIQ